jgi:two-component system response regulator CpxR
MRPKKVILCVDGDEKALSLRTFLLNTRANHCVMNAHNFGQALEILERTIPGTMDLLIVDLLLPGMDGNELVRRAKAMHPALPCLITSGTVATWERALYADAFLPKCSAEDLLERSRHGRAQAWAEAVPPADRAAAGRGGSRAEEAGAERGCS